MAIPSGSGTEVLKSIMWEDADENSADAVFTGVQNHIYTVVSIIISNQHSASVQVSGNLFGYDSYGSANSQYIRIFRETIPVNGTFVFNDKFCFHGQGSNNAVQKMTISCGNVCDVTMTYIDQDWT